MMRRHPDRSSVLPRAALTGDQHRSALAAPGVTWGQGFCVASSLAARGLRMRIPRPLHFPTPQAPGAAGGLSDRPRRGHTLPFRV